MIALTSAYCTLNSEYGPRLWPGCPQFELIMMAVAIESQLTHTSPRAYYVAEDFAGRSFWKQLRKSPNRRDGALLRFLGVPWFLFIDLVSAMERVLPSKFKTHNRGPVRARSGRPLAFDAMDLTALALRRFQTQGRQEALCIDFGVSKTVMSST